MRQSEASPKTRRGSLTRQQATPNAPPASGGVTRGITTLYAADAAWIGGDDDRVGILDDAGRGDLREIHRARFAYGADTVNNTIKNTVGIAGEESDQDRERNGGGFYFRSHFRIALV